MVPTKHVLFSGAPAQLGVPWDPLELDLHPRTGPPPGQDDAFEQALARRIHPAPDECGERTVAVHDLVHGLEPGGVPVDAPLPPDPLHLERRPATVNGPKNGVAAAEAGRPTS